MRSCPKPTKDPKFYQRKRTLPRQTKELNCDSRLFRTTGATDDAGHSLRRLCAAAHPIIHSGKVQIGINISLFRIVVPDDFDELTIPGTAGISYYNFVIGAISGAFAAETDGYCHKTVSRKRSKQTKKISTTIK